LSVDGIEVGPPVDEYSATESYGNYDLGTLVIGAAGKHSFKFMVTGRNASSGDFKIAFDDLRLDTL
jgi:hypothetical protein